MKFSSPNILMAVLLAFSSTGAYAQVENHDVRVGNKLYRNSNFDGAEAKYRSALSKKESSFYANFNLGNVLYKKKDWLTARNYYQKAASLASDKKLQAEALHNVGCTFLQEKKYKEAVDVLEKSMILNPKSEETRRQLAYAMRMLKKNPNTPPPSFKNQKYEDDSQDDNRKLLESLDEDEENKKPNSGDQSKLKNW